MKNTKPPSTELQVFIYGILVCLERAELTNLFVPDGGIRTVSSIHKPQKECKLWHYHCTSLSTVIDTKNKQGCQFSLPYVSADREVVVHSSLIIHHKVPRKIHWNFTSVLSMNWCSVSRLFNSWYYNALNLKNLYATCISDNQVCKIQWFYAM